MKMMLKIGSFSVEISVNTDVIRCLIEISVVVWIIARYLNLVPLTF